MVICIHCKTELTNENWYPSLKLSLCYICKKCHKKLVHKYVKKVKYNLTKKRKEYKRKWFYEHSKIAYKYVKKYRIKHPEKVKEYNSLERARRRRDYPTNIILNEYFEGSHLHHLTPWVAMYIPDGMHKSIQHNLRTGKNMYEINRKALDFWLSQGVRTI